MIAPMSNTDLQGLITTTPNPSAAPIALPEVIPHLSPGTLLLIGVAKPVIKRLAETHSVRIVETADVDEIAVLNSVPTAEGAIQVAMEETKITIHGSTCLVVGFGRAV